MQLPVHSLSYCHCPLAKEHTAATEHTCMLSGERRDGSILSSKREGSGSNSGSGQVVACSLARGEVAAVTRESGEVAVCSLARGKAFASFCQ